MGFPPINSEPLEINVKGGGPLGLEWWQWALIGVGVIGGLIAVGYVISAVKGKPYVQLVYAPPPKKE